MCIDTATPIYRRSDFAFQSLNWADFPGDIPSFELAQEDFAAEDLSLPLRLDTSIIECLAAEQNVLYHDLAISRVDSFLNLVHIASEDGFGQIAPTSEATAESSLEQELLGELHAMLDEVARASKHVATKQSDHLAVAR
jgi:hypothetical protein